MSKVDEVLGAVEEMTVLELADLVKKLEEKFGITGAMPTVAATPTPTSVETPIKEEFDVILVSAGEKKIQVLKVLREITGLGLKEAKEVVDNTPRTIKEKIKKEEAEEIKKKLESEGGKVEIK